MARIDLVTTKGEPLNVAVKNILTDYARKVMKQEKINTGLQAWNFIRSAKAEIIRSIKSGRYHRKGKWVRYGGNDATQMLRIRKVKDTSNHTQFSLVMVNTGKSPNLPDSVNKKWVWSPVKYMTSQRYGKTKKNYIKHIRNPIRRTIIRYRKKVR